MIVAANPPRSEAEMRERVDARVDCPWDVLTARSPWRFHGPRVAETLPALPGGA
jgi:hypothetical protein